ncbi:chaperonin 10-like protein [Mycena polygramma]|nr:chaperonin 10-like protein [Mycena polygramma]
MATSGEQRSLAIPYKGGPFTIIRRAIPTPGPGDLLVRMEGTGLNPAEWKTDGCVRLGHSYRWGFVGQDGAGTVVDVGQGVTNSWLHSASNKGDRSVSGWFTAERNTFQDYALIDANLTATLPENVSSLEAASIPLALATAALGLGQEFPANTVLGGGSMVGQFVIQIAKFMGFSSIVMTSSLKHSGYLESLGATHVIDRYAETAQAVEKLKVDLGIDIGVVYDAVHTPITQTELDLLSPNGTLVSIWELPQGGELLFKDGRRAVASYGSVQMHKGLGKQLYARMSYFLQEGIITPARVNKLSGGLAGITDGLGRLQRNEVSGIKLVVDPRETGNV